MPEISASEQEQMRRSAEMFELILQSAPEAIENYESLKDIYRNLGRSDKLKHVYIRLAGHYAGSGNPDGVKAELEKALAEFPDDPAILSKLEESGFSAPSDSFDQKILDYEDLCIRYEDAWVRLRLVQYAMDNAKSAFGMALEKESLLSDPGEASRAIEQVVDNRIKLKQAAMARSAIRGSGKVYSELKVFYEERMRDFVAENTGAIATGFKAAESMLADLDREYSSKLLETEMDFHEPSIVEAEDLLAKEREKARVELPRKLMEARKQAERTLEEKQKEYQSTVGELSDFERRKSEMEECIERIIENLDGEKHGRAKAEFMALSHGVELVSLDEGIVNFEERPEDPPKGRIDVLARDLKVIEDKGRGGHKEQASPATPKQGGASHSKGARSTRAPEAIDDKTMSRLSGRLGSMLMKHGVITEKNLSEALEEQKRSRQNLGLILTRSGFASDEEILNCISKETGMPYLPLGSYEINPKAIGLFPAVLAMKYGVVPVDMISNTLLVSTSNPIDAPIKAEIEKQIKNMKVSYYVSSTTEVEEKLQEIFPS